MNIILENEELKLKITNFGAELQEINSKENGKNYLWNGHSAFVVPVDKREECFLKFDNKNNLTNIGLENGLANEKNLKNGKIVTEKGYLKIEKDLFQYDALILENAQVREILLCTPDKKEFIMVKFDSPLVGIWSPYKEKCPFVCIEPWYGRCDSVEFDGELQDRKWQQSLAEGEIFQSEYEIVIN